MLTNSANGEDDEVGLKEDLSDTVLEVQLNHGKVKFGSFLEIDEQEVDIELLKQFEHIFAFDDSNIS